VVDSLVAQRAAKPCGIGLCGRVFVRGEKGAGWTAGAGRGGRGRAGWAESVAGTEVGGEEGASFVGGVEVAEEVAEGG
jgi:hypothetical protein